MSRSRIGALLALAIAAVSSLIVAPARAVIAFIDRSLGYIPLIAEAPRFRDAAPALALEGFGGFTLDPSLLQRQRHEAGLARLGAVRHV